MYDILITRMKLLSILLLCIIPSATLANGSLLLQHREERRQMRLAQMHSEQTTVRIGRAIRTVNVRSVRSGSTGLVYTIADGSVFGIEESDGDKAGIRILGADAPVIHPTSETEQCHAREAKAALERLLLGKQVTLERDENYQRDSYGFALRYVRLGGLDVGGWMIWSGYAFSDSEHDHERQDLYESLEEEAQEAERGLWSYQCDYNETPRRSVEVLE